MRSVIGTLVVLSLVSILGCASGPAVQWSEDIAQFAESQDSKLNDHHIYSVGQTSPLISEAKDEKSVAEADKFTQATLEWRKPQPIQRVIIKAEIGQLEFFEIQYLDAEDNWQTIRSVKNHVREEYKLKLKEPIHTRKLRLKVPIKWESRRMGGQKKRTRGEGGAPVAAYKKIRDIEVYYVLPAGEPTTTP
ncbi:MAG: hypothetical protein O7E52_17925 [Candidatus Poribacteria bacterium]|nr:hypothetical protein [Candidatus Poribacteria bacterium]